LMEWPQYDPETSTSMSWTTGSCSTPHSS
jgi:hypothetical protein